ATSASRSRSSPTRSSSSGRARAARTEGDSRPRPTSLPTPPTSRPLPPPPAARALPTTTSRSRGSRLGRMAPARLAVLLSQASPGRGQFVEERFEQSGEATRPAADPAQGQRQGAPRRGPAQAMPVLPRQGRRRRLQGLRHASPGDEREGQDPLRADHGSLPAPPAAARDGDKARPRARPAP